MISLNSKIIYIHINRMVTNRFFQMRFSETKTLLSELHNETSYLFSDNLQLLLAVKQDFKVFENFISESEEDNLLKEIDPLFKRKRYQFDHWDGAIQGYRETEKSDWNEENSRIIQKLQETAFPPNVKPMKLVHILDLIKNGHIKPHVDSVRFCGDTIAGISLLSSSIMRLVMEQNKNSQVDILLPRRSLYIMRGDVRYQFSHEILKDSESYFKGTHIPRERRISIICRNEPEDNNYTTEVQ